MSAASRRDVSVPLCYLGTSFMVSFLLVKWMSPVVSPLIYPAYSGLPRNKQLDWDTRVASNVHAVLVCLLVGFIFGYEQRIYDDPVWGESLVARSTCGIVVGYLLSDVVIIIIHWKHLGHVIFLLHHAVTIVPYYFILNYGVMIYFGMFRLLAELSTPFVNQRWIMETMGYRKKHKSYIINGLIMTATFFVARVLSIPYWYWIMYWVRHDKHYHRDVVDYYYWIAFCSCVVLDVMNCFWMTKIGRGVMKILRSLKETDSNDNEQEKED